MTFDETDKAFIPNKEVVTSDWAVDSLHSLPASDKILVYQTLPPSPSTPPPPPSPRRRALRKLVSFVFPFPSFLGGISYYVYILIFLKIYDTLILF